MRIRNTTNPAPNIINGFNDGKTTSNMIVSIKSNITTIPNAIRNLDIPFMFLALLLNL